MSAAARAEPEASGFTASRERFESVLAFLDGAQAAAACHAELEDHLQVHSRELFRQLYQDHLELRAQRESRVAVIGADGAARSPPHSTRWSAGPIAPSSPRTRSPTPRPLWP